MSLLQRNQLASTNAQDKFYVTIEVTDYYGTKKRQEVVSVQRGTMPTVGTYIELFRKCFNVETDLKDWPRMEFKVTNPEPKGIRMLRPLQLVRDYASFR